MQGLTEEHKRQRLEFCHNIQARLRDNPNLLNSIMFTDEATFTTNGMFNRKNKHYWATQNPHKIQAVKIQGRNSLNVWCGIMGDKVIGPLIFQGSLTGQRYLEFLENQIEELLEEIPLAQYNNSIWHQDGAPAHNTIPVRDFLNNRYGVWIGRNGPIRWPANSPDLTPLDVFLWGYLKNKIYYNRPVSINIIEQRLREEISLLNRYHSEFTREAVNHKLRINIRDCIENNGGYIENK